MVSESVKTQENVTDNTYETSSEEDGLYEFRKLVDFYVSEFSRNKVFNLSHFLLSYLLLDERIWAAISFVMILIIIGVPLWWKMTEVERSYFPYEDIADLRHQNVTFCLKTNVYTATLSAKKLEDDLRIMFSHSGKGNIHYCRYCQTNVDSDLFNIWVCRAIHH